MKASRLVRMAGYKTYRAVRGVPRRARLAARAVFYRYLFQFRAVKAVRSGLRLASSRLFRLKTRLALGISGQRFSLMPMSRYIEQSHVWTTTIVPARELHICGPRFIGDYEFTPISEAAVCIDEPKLEVSLIRDAVVVGGTNFIFKNSTAVHPDAYIPDRDVSPAELNGIADVNSSERTITICMANGRSVEKAVSLLGSCTGNYAHWLTETLPKLLIVDGIEEFASYPLLVDSWIHPRFVESILLLGATERDLIHVKRWHSAKVGSLIDVTPTAYVPPEDRYFFENKRLGVPRAGDFTFSRVGLNLLRERALAAVHEKLGERHQKLYLYRAHESCGNARHVTNIDEIERLIQDYGYSMLDPAKLTFDEQVVAFSCAQKVVSPLGAALANTIFAPPGCKVVGLSPYYENANYYYFSNFMGALGHEMYYVLGRQVDKGVHLLHMNYEVDIKAFARALEFLDEGITNAARGVI